MDIQVIHRAVHDTGISASKTRCTHGRLIDDIRTRNGKPTGKVRCLECGAVLDDPYKTTQ